MASTGCSSLCTWFDKSERCGRYLTKDEAAEIGHAGRVYLSMCEQLARHAARTNTVRWKLVPKHHVLWLDSRLHSENRFIIKL